MVDLLLGLDIGTSGVKVGVCDAEGHLLGLGRAAHENDSPESGWVQCPAERWWEGVVVSLRQACGEAGVGPEAVGAVGVSVLFPCIVALDAEGRGLYPAQLYSDRRSFAQVEAIERAIPRDAYEATIGNVLIPGTCAVTSLAWLRDEQPEVYRQAHSFGFSNTAITARLTGEFAADPAMVALSGLVDIRDPWRWNGALCEALGIDASRLPRVAGAAEVVGQVTRAAAEETGLRPGIPVVCGTGDVPCSAVGVGATASDTVVYVAGSTDCVAVPIAQPTPDLRWVNASHVPRGLWLAIGSATSSGVSVEWFVRELLDSSGTEGLRELTALAERSRLGSGGVVYLPYLQGERTPIWDPKARGCFFGLSSTTTRGDLARAVLEGTAFGLKHIIDSLEEVAGGPVGEILTVGGGTKNALWNQIKADVVGKPLAVLEFQETSSLGAALLGGLGAGLYGSFEETVEVARGANSARVVAPEPARTAQYAEQLDVFTALYPATKALAHRLAQPRGGT